jgi:hypothetical protein
VRRIICLSVTRGIFRERGLAGDTVLFRCEDSGSPPKHGDMLHEGNVQIMNCLQCSDFVGSAFALPPGTMKEITYLLD